MRECQFALWNVMIRLGGRAEFLPAPTARRPSAQSPPEPKFTGSNPVGDKINVDSSQPQLPQALIGYGVMLYGAYL
jgi:hypothetical protein